jgi:hypothetical protein
MMPAMARPHETGLLLRIVYRSHRLGREVLLFARGQF